MRSVSLPDYVQSLGVCFKRYFKKQKIIFYQDDEAEHLYIVQSGIVKLERYLEEKVNLARFCQKGDCFGEETLLKNVNFFSTAVAKTDCEILKISKKNVEKLLERDHLFSVLILTFLAQLHGYNMKKADWLYTAQAKERVVLAQDFLEEQELVDKMKITHEEIGTFVNLTRESVSRHIKN